MPIALLKIPVPANILVGHHAANKDVRRYAAPPIFIVPGERTLMTSPIPIQQQQGDTLELQLEYFLMPLFLCLSESNTREEQDTKPCPPLQAATSRRKPGKNFAPLRLRGIALKYSVLLTDR
jgi:hypothetical protein